VIVIFTDDQGYSDVGCYGCVDFETPHIDSLARDGLRFTSGYVSHPYCSPSRAGILSARYQQSFGHEANPLYDEANDKIGIPVTTTLLPDLFQKHGYRTAAFGKWHLGAGKPFRPSVRGFGKTFVFLGGGHDYFGSKPGGKNYQSPIWIDGTPSDFKITYVTDDISRAAVEFIAHNKTNPFMMYVAYNAPHAPDQATPQYLDRVKDIKHPKRRVYAAMVTAIDDGVGRIVETLKEHGLYRNTLLVYLSDNGGRALSADNRPLRGNKGWLYEGGIRVPFIMTWPDRFQGNRVVDTPVSALDILPTGLAAANMPVPAGLDGVNLLPYLTGETTNPPHKTLHWRVSGGKGFALREGRWKLVKDIGMDQAELYDLDSDIGETKDLAKSKPELLQRLLAEHRAWNETLVQPLFADPHPRNMERERANSHNLRCSKNVWYLTK
jgi:arylsulfatase A-like enzyme